jgi:hypothetical protein
VAHPAVASVLYLGDVGGATAVFGQSMKPASVSTLTMRVRDEVLDVVVIFLTLALRVSCTGT